MIYVYGTKMPRKIKKDNIKHWVIKLTDGCGLYICVHERCKPPHPSRHTECRTDSPPDAEIPPGHADTGVTSSALGRN